MKKILLSTIFFSLVISAYSEHITQNQARNVAISFLQEKGYTNLQVAATKTQKARAVRDNRPYYVFNIEDNNGFVIVSGDDRTVPILGYVPSGQFDEDLVPNNMKAWLEKYSLQMQNIPSDYNPIKHSGTAWSTVDPLITTKWNQGSPYNGQCPEVNGTKSVTGCVATAFAQVLNYWRYPDYLPQADSYEWNGSVLPTLPDYAVNWSTLKDTYNYNDIDDNLAWLMRYCGQYVQMNYSPSGSGAALEYIAVVMKDKLGYQNNKLQSIYRNKYSASQWEEIIYHELANKRPVIYSSSSSEGGHAFICDGYDGSGYYHINWGWGGYCDGFFCLSIMNPNGADYVDFGSYNMWQSAIIGISPQQQTDESLINTCCESYFANYENGIITYAIYSVLREKNNFDFGYAFINPADFSINSILQVNYEGKELEYESGVYVSMNLAELADGSYNIAPACKLSGSAEWQLPTGINYISVEKSGSDIYITQHPIQDIGISNCQFNVDYVSGDITFLFTLTNQSTDDINTPIYYGVKMPDGRHQRIGCESLIASSGNSIDFQFDIKLDRAAVSNSEFTFYLTIVNPEYDDEAFNSAFWRKLVSFGEEVVNNPEAIDLGLPSGRRWASFDFGAPDNKHNGTTVTWHDLNVVTQEWGEEWEVPSVNDYMELIKNCTGSWETLDGTITYKFEGKNGNCIYMPIQKNNRIYYWTSTEIDEQSAHLFVTDAENVPNPYWSISKDAGIAVRPVAVFTGEKKISIESLIPSSSYYEANATANLTAKIRNFGTPLNNLKFKVEVDGSETTYNTFNSSISSDESIELTLQAKMPATFSQNTKITASVVEIDGKPYEGEPATCTTSVIVVDKLYDRNVVIEEGTGTWCGWCVRGVVSMETMKEKYPDSFIGIAIHSSDPMAVNNYPPNVSGFPKCNIDRTMWDKVVDVSLFENYYTQERMRKTLVDIDLNAYVEGNNVIANSSLSFELDQTNVDYRMVYVLKEDSVTGYSQKNSYSGLDTPMGGFENQPEVIENFTFYDVARTIYPNYEGIEGQITTIYKGKTINDNIEIELPSSIQDPNHLTLVAILLDGKTGEIVQAEQIKLPYTFTEILVENITLNTTDVELDIDDTIELQATVYPIDATNKDVAWASSDNAVATVSKTGLVTAIAPGKATISATAVDGSGVSASCTINVRSSIVEAESIVLDKTELTLHLNERDYLTATIYPENTTDKTIKWTSSDEGIVYVEDGFLYSISFGKAIITATCGNVSATCEVSVVPILVESIELNITAYTLEIGETILLEATVLPKNATNKEIEWSSSDEDVVKVNEAGYVTFVGFGDAVVSATAKDGSGIFATCVFTNIDGIQYIYTDENIDIFTLDGKKVQNAGNGIYIINGKKLLK